MKVLFGNVEIALVNSTMTPSVRCPLAPKMSKCSLFYSTIAPSLPCLLPLTFYVTCFRRFRWDWPDPRRSFVLRSVVHLHNNQAKRSNIVFVPTKRISTLLSAYFRRSLHFQFTIPAISRIFYTFARRVLDNVTFFERNIDPSHCEEQQQHRLLSFVNTTTRFLAFSSNSQHEINERSSDLVAKERCSTSSRCGSR